MSPSVKDIFVNYNVSVHCVDWIAVEFSKGTNDTGVITHYSPIVMGIWMRSNAVSFVIVIFYVVAAFLFFYKFDQVTFFDMKAAVKAKEA